MKKVKYFEITKYKTGPFNHYSETRLTCDKFCNDKSIVYDPFFSQHYFYQIISLLWYDNSGERYCYLVNPIRDNLEVIEELAIQKGLV